MVLADDTGVEIDALGGEPGIHVRRWDGTRMTDMGIINYCLEKLTGVVPEERSAKFRTVVALGIPGIGIELWEGTLKGFILDQADLNYLMKGFPFESLFFVPEFGEDGMLLGEIHRLSGKAKNKYLTHRERAIKAALPRIRELL